MPITKKNNVVEDDTKHCPYCDNEIKSKAIKCQYCWEFLDEKHVKNHISEELKNNDISAKWWTLLNWRSLKSVLRCEWRMNRWEYWFYHLAGFLVYFWLCFVVWFIIGLFTNGYISDWTSKAVAYWLMIPIYVWFVMVWICRLHDLWKKRPLIILWFIPIANIIIWLMLWFSKWNEWKNEFWEEPKSLTSTVNIVSIIMAVLIVVFMVRANS